MNASLTIFLRALGALLIASIIAGLHFLIWAVPNRGTQYSEAGAAHIAGFAYSPYQKHQDPVKKQFPTEADVEKDIELLSTATGRIRTYGAADIPSLVPTILDNDLQILAGVWIANGSATSEEAKATNEREIATMEQLVKKYGTKIDRIVVGNETQLLNYLPKEQLIDYIKEVKKRTKRQVSTAEPVHIWLANPDLAAAVDFITVHILPYHERKEIENAVSFAYERYDELAKAYPKKKIVIGEIGWPSRGPQIGASIASLDNQARFIREFLTHPRTPKLDYYLMEAIDQPWKIDAEGWAGAYWGRYDADRQPKYALEGVVARDPKWQHKALVSGITAFLPMLLVAFFLRGWGIMGRLWIAALIQACVATVVIGLNVPADYYLSQNATIGLFILTLATLLTAAVLLSHGFEFGEVFFKKTWARRFRPLPPVPAEQEPFVSIHLACYSEPPEMVIATMDSLAKMNYNNFEVLILDNNTKDETLWKPLEARAAELGERFRFFHLENWPGFKAGALNFGLRQTDPRAQVVGVVDADYVVDPNWLSGLVPHFTDKKDVVVVQAPQAHRDWETQPFRRMCNWEFDGFFRIGMHHRNERNALIQHGTMTLVKRNALEEVGGWSEWCICEDTELGLRLIEKGYDTRYVDEILGRGLTPSDFAAIKSQRFRWAFGAMQIFKAHIGKMVGPSMLNLSQRYHFFTGWFAWFGDALQLIFAFASILWTLGMIIFPGKVALPVPALAMPVLGFMIFKAALGPILYRRTMKCPWWDILGASILSVGLSHAIALGIFNGIFKKKGEFVRTPKGWRAQGMLAFIGPLREEIGLLVTLLISAAGLYYLRGWDDIEAKLWTGILLMECTPYVAAIGCQIAAYWPDKASDTESAPKLAAS